MICKQNSLIEKIAFQFFLTKRRTAVIPFVRLFYCATYSLSALLRLNTECFTINYSNRNNFVFMFAISIAQVAASVNSILAFSKTPSEFAQKVCFIVRGYTNPEFPRTSASVTSGDT